MQAASRCGSWRRRAGTWKSPTAASVFQPGLMVQHSMEIRAIGGQRKGVREAEWHAQASVGGIKQGLKFDLNLTSLRCRDPSVTYVPTRSRYMPRDSGGPGPKSQAVRVKEDRQYTNGVSTSKVQTADRFPPTTHKQPLTVARPSPADTPLTDAPLSALYGRVCLCVCLHFLVLYFQLQSFTTEVLTEPDSQTVRTLSLLQESQQSSADFRIYIENHTRHPDDLSRKQIRIYQLYSRTTGKHVQILGKKVNANGDDGGKYGLESFPSQKRLAKTLCARLHTNPRAVITAGPTMEGQNVQLRFGGRGYSGGGMSSSLFFNVTSQTCFPSKEYLKGHLLALPETSSPRTSPGSRLSLLVVETETFGSHIRIKGKESEYYICMNKNGKIVGKLNGRNQECVFVEEFLENNYTALVSAKYKGWYLGFNRKGRPKKGSRTTQTQQEVHFMKRHPKGKVDPLEEFRFTTATRIPNFPLELDTMEQRNGAKKDPQKDRHSPESTLSPQPPPPSTAASVLLPRAVLCVRVEVLNEGNQGFNGTPVSFKQTDSDPLLFNMLHKATGRPEDFARSRQPRGPGACRPVRHPWEGLSSAPGANCVLAGSFEAHISTNILVNFYRCTVESILTNCATVWYNGCSAANWKSLQLVVKTAQSIIGVQLPAIKDIQHKYLGTAKVIR
ncbi:hypothetical protein DPEC_G00026830 [Dallia pectoralis]|uniref:Uncharacterized protein n=1 Tax=Dallia pectoralis TaxID=75939 RepID=A0ACC2HIN9_DALPE|nr:hypothetical protein DPEC_G00026830 [Dallia pectoralis]